MNFARWNAVVLIFASSAALAAQTVTSGLGTGVVAGQNANLKGTGLNVVTKVELQADGKQPVTIDNAALTKTDTTGLSFTVPASTTAGAYTITLTPGGKQTPQLTVTAAAAPPPVAVPAAPATPVPVVDSVFPRAPFPTQNRFSFDINGSNFNKDAIVSIEGQPDIRFRHRESDGGCENYLKDLAELPCLEASADGRRLSIKGFEKRSAYQGPAKVRVLVNGVPSEVKAFTLSRIDHRIVVWLTFLVFALLAGIVYRLVARGIKPYVIGGQKFSPLAAFLLDKETDSYSLSKFQLLAFSSVSFFAYIYVFLCRTLVQWNFDFPDVPENYPALLAISAGTTAAATGLGSLRGTKGGGNVLPSAADFICNGGMVVADRFQFFVWTLIACLGFIALILMQDPATVQGFPNFPNGLLYVMGVSAGGYLGGKAARNPGPVLKNVKVRALPAPSQDLSVTLLGSNLDKKARFRIDGSEQSTVAPPAVGGAPQVTAVTGTSQPGAPNDYCSQLDFVLLRAAGFAAGDHTFEIVNADGLGSQANFTGDPMDIAAQNPNPVGVGATAVNVVLTINNYRDGCTARWQPFGAAAPQDLPKPQFTPPNQVTVSLIPGAQAKPGTLTFVTPGGATETYQLNI